jgi:hypothetical protein
MAKKDLRQRGNSLFSEAIQSVEQIGNVVSPLKKMILSVFFFGQGFPSQYHRLCEPTLI